MGITSPFPSRWGDKVRVEGLPNMDGSPGARITRPLVTFPRSTPLTTATHWRSGREGMACQSRARVAPLVQSYSDVCTCG